MSATLKFMHHGIGGTSCNTPLGLCLTIPFKLTDPKRPLNPSQIAEGFGTADFQVDGNRLLVVFHRAAALPDGTVRIEHDKSLEPEIAKALGYEQIILKSGAYKVSPSKERFGEAWIIIAKQPPTPPPIEAFVECQRYFNILGGCKGCGVSCSDGNHPMSCSADIFDDQKICRDRRVRIDYDPRVYGEAIVYTDLTPPSIDQLHKKGIVKVFNRAGAQIPPKMQSAQNGDRRIKFTVLIPKRRK